MQFLLIEKAPGFLYDEVGYVDLAQSLLHHHSYSSDFEPENVQPPGLAVILAGTCATVGCGPNTLLRTTPIFFTLGLLVAYWVIRRQSGSLIAAGCCLLVAVSPELFPFVTSRFWPSFPYLFLSMLVLLLAPKLDAGSGWLRRFFAGLVLTALLIAAVMTQSAGIALMGALLGWAASSFLRDSATGRPRLVLVVPPILLALLVQTAWMQRGSDAKDWQLPGRGESYLAQLKVKNGNDPELGFATPKDIVLRVENNVRERVLFLGEVLTHRWISPSSGSVGVAGVVMLVLIGVGTSLWRAESQVCALYFIGYELIYVLWPWSFETPRFMLPVLPLAFLYLVEGARALVRWCREYPRKVGVIFLPIFGALAMLAARESLAAGAGRGSQDRMSAALWVVCALICAGLIWKKLLDSIELPAWARSLSGRSFMVGGFSLSPARLLGVLLLAGLVASGVAAEIPMGRANLSSGVEKYETIPEIRAALWIQSHTDASAVVAARQVSIIHHYSGRHVIWFPPITKPTMLMQGLEEHHVRYVVVVDRKFSYYLPPDAVCFDLLSKAYPDAFRLVEDSRPLRIYEVLPDSARVSINRAE